MLKEPNNIDRLVREKLDGFEMTPPPSVWENTSAALQSGRKKRFIIWFSLAICTLAFLTIGTYSYFNFNTTNLPVAKNDTREKQSRSSSLEADSHNSELNLNNKGKDDRSLPSEKEQEFNSSGASDSNFSENGLSRNSVSDHDHQGNTGHDESSHQKNGLNGSDKNSDLDAVNNLTQDDLAAPSPNSNEKSLENFESEFEFENPEGEDVTVFEKTNLYGSLPITPTQLLTLQKPKNQLVEFDDQSFLFDCPQRKAFSIEGSFGVSTFNNKANKSSTDTVTNSMLDNAASNRRSMDLRLGLNYHFTSRVSFQTGIHYNSSSEDYSYKDSETTTEVIIDTVSISVDTMTMDTTYITSTTFNDTTIVVDKSGVNTYKIFSLPFQLSWNQPISARGSLEFALGGALSIFGTNTGATIVSANNSLPASEAYHTSGMLSIGGSIKYLYHLNERSAIYVEPWAQFGVTNQFIPQFNYTSVRRRGGIRFGYRIYF